MPSFGQKLKTEREKRAVTLEQISSSTKIGTRMLQALEDENFDQLPGGIFNKGFVRAYARHLGLDEDQTIADYLQASGEVAAPLAEQKIEIAVPPPAPSATSTSQIPWGWLAGGLLALALALWIWSRWHHPAGPAHPPTATSQKSELPIANASVVLPASPPPAVFEPAAKPVPQNAPAAPPPIPATPIPSGTFTVVILARDDSWLSISVDGQPAVEETLTGENQHAIHASNQVVIKAGNIGALDFVFEGKKLPPQGDYGDVKTLTFGRAGLLPTAPAHSTSPQ